ncbi:ATP binding protein [Hordeum vulgare]|nr:ATP binding protein [Hordeum vulgare]
MLPLISLKSSGFSRGASVYTGVTRHHQHGRWQAIIGRVAGNKDSYLGTFGKLVAMDPDLKARVRADLESFAKGRAYYHGLGRVWRRSYLLQGPPGTGKSTLAAAMARFLGYDLYDVDLSRADVDLRALLMCTTPRRRTHPASSMRALPPPAELAVTLLRPRLSSSLLPTTSAALVYSPSSSSASAAPWLTEACASLLSRRPLLREQQWRALGTYMGTRKSYPRRRQGRRPSPEHKPRRGGGRRELPTAHTNGGVWQWIRERG